MKSGFSKLRSAAAKVKLSRNQQLKLGSQRVKDACVLQCGGGTDFEVDALFDLGRALLLKNVDDDTADGHALSALARCHVRSGEYELALARIKQAMKQMQNVADGSLWYVLGVVYHSTEEDEIAIEALERCTAMTLSLWPYDLADALHRLHQLAADHGDDRRAALARLEELQRLERMAPYTRGEISFKMSRLHSALSEPAEAAERALESGMDAEAPATWVALGRLSLGRRHLRQAFEQFRAALRCPGGRDLPDAWSELARLYVAWEQPSDASRMFGEAISRAPRDAGLRLEHVAALAAARQFESAIACCERARAFAVTAGQLVAHETSFRDLMGSAPAEVVERHQQTQATIKIQSVHRGRKVRNDKQFKEELRLDKLRKERERASGVDGSPGYSYLRSPPPVGKPGTPEFKRQQVLFDAGEVEREEIEAATCIQAIQRGRVSRRRKAREGAASVSAPAAAAERDEQRRQRKQLQQAVAREYSLQVALFRRGLVGEAGNRALASGHNYDHSPTRPARSQYNHSSVEYQQRLEPVKTLGQIVCVRPSLLETPPLQSGLDCSVGYATQHPASLRVLCRTNIAAVSGRSLNTTNLQRVAGTLTYSCGPP